MIWLVVQAGEKATIEGGTQAPMAKTITLDKWVWVFLLWPFIVWPMVGIVVSLFKTSDAQEEATTQEATSAETQPGKPASASRIDRVE